MTFCQLQNDESAIRGIHLEIIRKKLVIIMTYLLVSYIFFKICLYLYIKFTSQMKKGYRILISYKSR